MEFLKNINKENSIEGKDLAAALGAAMEKSAPNPEILHNLDDKDAKEVQEKTAKLIVSDKSSKFIEFAYMIKHFNNSIYNFRLIIYFLYLGHGEKCVG